MRVLIAVDSSQQTDDVLHFCAHCVCYPDEPFTLLTVVEHEKDFTSAKKILSEGRQFLMTRGVEPHIKIRSGHPAEEIIVEAEEYDYNLVVIGEGKHRNLATRFLLGSTSIRVAERAPCAVMIVKGKGRPVRRILLCDSGAKQSLAHSHFASILAELFAGDAEITILHVMSQIGAWPGVSGSQLRASAEDLIMEHSVEGEFLLRDLKSFERPRFSSNPKIRHGLVVEEILAEAELGDYDLLVIGAHKSDGWQRILLDDLAKKIMIRSERPVLVVR